MEPGPLLQLLPLIVLTLLLNVPVRECCRRKGKNMVYAWIALIPFPLIAIVILIWLSSFPDTELLARLDAIEKRLSGHG